MINKKDLELKLLLRESHIQQLNLKVERLNNILDTLMQDMALLNATGIKEVNVKHVFDRIVMLRGEDDE